MNSINRQVVIIKPKNLYVTWISSLPDMADESVTIESLQNDCTALLVPHFDEEEELFKFIKNIYQQIFEKELWGWSTDKDLWPVDLNYSLFQNWFEIEVHSEVFDLGENSIGIDEY